MTMYIVYPIGTEDYKPRLFENMMEAIAWEYELAMKGINTESEVRETYCVA